VFRKGKYNLQKCHVQARDHLGNIGVDVRIILKLTLQKWDMRI